MVEPAEAARPQEMGEPVAAQLQLGTGHGVAACRHDEGRLVLPNVTRLRIPEHREPYPWARAWRPASRNDSKKTASYLGRGITIKLAAILQIEAAELLRGRPSTPRRK